MISRNFNIKQQAALSLTVASLIFVGFTDSSAVRREMQNFRAPPIITVLRLLAHTLSNVKLTSTLLCYPLSLKHTQHLLFGEEKQCECDWRNPGKLVRQSALASAVSTIIWRAGDGCTGERTRVLTDCSGRFNLLFCPK